MMMRIVASEYPGRAWHVRTKQRSISRPRMLGRAAPRQGGATPADGVAAVPPMMLLRQDLAAQVVVRVGRSTVTWVSRGRPAAVTSSRPGAARSRT
ncbi:hypothetical protein Plo01_64700 [Planobispora longispora]|uniref:Uncharacterized protein n=1 Tax=Planobispora longispora TaxID=28887 RepID=A0A8J3W9P5_9ACTN|nr:hypothetical protein GCM10020093_018390 [Planobispora longispora]GIH80041.1 hypothetical protein Plo01_64700 [Planobispora longispora]